MSPTHRFIDSLGKVIEGRDKMREGWAAYFRMVPDYSVAIEEIYPGEPVVVMLGMASGTYSRDGKLNPENRWQTPVRDPCPHRRQPGSRVASTPTTTQSAK